MHNLNSITRLHKITVVSHKNTFLFQLLFLKFTIDSFYLLYHVVDNLCHVFGKDMDSLILFKLHVKTFITLLELKDIFV